MVGKPHSTGCITCIRRKVKCDERRPSCQKCSRASIPCQGYRDVGAAGRRSPSSAEPSESHTSSREDAVISASPDMWPFLEEMSINFLIRNFFKQRSRLSRDGLGSAWLEDAFASRSNPVARIAAGCLATGYFWSTHSADAKVLEHSERQYGRALVALKSRLSDPHACWDNENLSAAMALQCYELLLRPDASGWIQHAGGMARFIEARGPARHQDYPEHGIFMWARNRIFANAMMTRKRTFLEEKDWLTLPWVKHPETIQHERELWELRITLPGLWQEVMEFEEAFLSPQQNPLHETVRIGLVERIEKILERLLRWRFRWEAQNGRCTQVRSAHTVSNLISDIPRPAAFTRLVWFDDMFLANEIIYYHTVLVMLLYFGVRLFEPFLLSKTLSHIPASERAEPIGVLLVPHESMTVLDYSTEMGCILDYVLCTSGMSSESLPMVGTLRLNVVLFSLLLEDHEKTAWITRVVTRLAEQGGMKSLKRFTDTTPPLEDIGALRSLGPQDEQVVRIDFLPLESHGATYAPETLAKI